MSSITKSTVFYKLLMTVLRKLCFMNNSYDVYYFHTLFPLDLTTCSKKPFTSVGMNRFPVPVLALYQYPYRNNVHLDVSMPYLVCVPLM